MIIEEGEHYYHKNTETYITLLKYDKRKGKVIVKFHPTDNNDGGIIETSAKTYATFKKNGKRSPFAKTFKNVGYIGEFKSFSKDKLRFKLLRIWEDMLNRCHNPNSNNAKNYHNRNVKVDPIWHNFHNFYMWAVNRSESNFIYGMDMSLDKDLLQPNQENKIYSPETCIFIPSPLNTAISDMERVDNKNNNHQLPPGVTYERSGRYTSRVKLSFNGNVFLRCQLTTSSLLNEVCSAYVTVKEYYFKKLATYYYERNLLSYKGLRVVYEFKIVSQQVPSELIDRNFRNEQVLKAIGKIDDLFSNLKNKDTLKAQRLSEQDLNEKSFNEN